MSRQNRLLGLVCPVALILGSYGCSRITEPEASRPGAEERAAISAGAGGHGEFYPLELGNRWHYVYTFSSQFVPADGSTPEPPVIERSVNERTLVCVQDVDGRSYTVERQQLKSGASAWWTLYRQDRTGLYSGGIVRIPPACDSGTSSAVSRTSVASTRDPLREARTELESRAASLMATVFGSSLGDRESQQLQYPLHPGSRWDVRPKPLLSAEVEGVDVLNLPTGPAPAYRIRLTGEALGANDQFRVWYGRSGYLGLAGHFQYESTLPRGTFVGEFSEVLDEISLNSPSGRVPQ